MGGERGICEIRASILCIRASRAVIRLPGSERAVSSRVPRGLSALLQRAYARISSLNASKGCW